MIFVEEPWYNEPGREEMPNKTSSKRYNIQIQGYTIEHAMLGWLTDRLAPPKTAMPGPSSWALDGSGARRYVTRAAAASSAAAFSAAAAAPAGAAVKDDPIWGEVIRKHFAASGRAIVERVTSWNQPPSAKDVISRLIDALALHGCL